MGVTPRRTPWRLVVLAILVIALSTQPVFLLGAGFLDIGPELGFGPAGLGVLTATFFLTASVSSAPLGRVVERIGWRRAIRVNAAVSGMLLVVIPLVVHSLGAMAVLLMASGLVYGVANPAVNKALAEQVDPLHRAFLFGLKHAGIPTSTLVAGLTVPVVVLRFGWRASYAIVALLAIVVLALVPGGAPRGDVAPPSQPDARRRVAPMSPRLLAGLASGSALGTWAAIALSTYLVAATVAAGFSQAAAGWLLFAGSASSIGGRLIAGRVTDRMGGKGFGAIAALTGVGAVVFLLIPLGSGAVLTLLVLVAFATGWGWPGLMTYTVVNANAGTAAASSGIIQAGVFVGAGLGPLVLGAVAERWSFDAVWLVVAGALAAASVVVSIAGHRAVTTGGSVVR